MDAAKIRLSPKEAELISSSDFILTKNEIIRKVSLLLGRIAGKQQEALQQVQLPQHTGMVSPKISKGENYHGLPWLMLDHPRLFDKEKILAVRTMFWWGHFFSTTIHLSGYYKRELEKRIIGLYHLFSEEQFYTCINNDPWEHHFEPANYIPVSGTGIDSFEKIITEKPFIKLAAKISLSEWDDAEKKLLHQYAVILKVFDAAGSGSTE